MAIDSAAHTPYHGQHGMIARSNRAGGSTWRELRPIMLLLLLAVVVPAACLLWFMSEAANNERLAARQKLTELYGARLAELQVEVDTYWERKLHALAQSYPGEADGERFARLVEAGVAHSVIVYDGPGRVAYPVAASGRESETDAERTFAREAGILRDKVAALVVTGDVRAASMIVRDELGRPRYRTVHDASGRLIAPSVELLILRHSDPFGDALRDVIRDRLVQRLRDYGDLTLPSGQRRFLMGMLVEEDTTVAFPTLDAERLAAEYLQSEAAAPQALQLACVGSGALWHLGLPDRSLVAIYRPEALADELGALIAAAANVPGVTIDVCPASRRMGEAFLRRPAGRHMPGWELRLAFDAADPFAAAANRKIGVYLWIGLLAIALVAALASTMAGIFLRQIRLTRLKNDFVATVSHELKTPLASMRVLVDTLLEGRTRDEQQAAEYLRLIARENERLSRLIDNFLSFSRMERNKRAFDFESVAAEDIVRPAVEAVRERFEANGCVLEVELPPGLPKVVADRDAMITVLLNLLDNAYKYSQEEKQITVRVFAEKANVFFVVSDKGIGLSRREAGKIMERFYQVDRSLSRKTGGCGLGLSIVKFIVDAHHGSIDIQGQPGEGSTFAVGIPKRSTAGSQQPTTNDHGR